MSDNDDFVVDPPTLSSEVKILADELIDTINSEVHDSLYNEDDDPTDRTLENAIIKSKEIAKQVASYIVENI